MFLKKDCVLDDDGQKYLSSHNYSFKGLLHGSKPKPSWEPGSNVVRACDCTMAVVATFAVSMGAFLLPRVLAVLCILAAGYIIGRLACSMFILVLSVLVGKIHKNQHERAVVFWSWFPCWKFILCCLACLAGALTGHHLWQNYWQQYSDVSLLKAYHGIDPSVVPGSQIQDAGAVDFVAAGVDSEHGGCFMNAGTTYCVAPIVTNGTIHHSVGGAPRYGSFDYFAVGVDCCSCPNINFRCGAWRHPWAEGGIRSTDLEARPFFRLAVDGWASTYRKTSSHPLFFEWVESPVAHWKSLRHQFLKRLLLALAMCSALVLAFTLTLSRVLQALVVHGFASPLNAPAPPEGFEAAWARFLPQMLESYKESQLQQNAPSFTESPESLYGAVDTSSTSQSA
ncbi:CELF4 [Symbiodinium natans]|uniref:CELF4 protein n=1 Tax=Symbiodinium natans TaxID=878477 RepID=A0A812Q567_9DINO|nr:CELF4 [Symbiodinium natans]